ncbi:hypothetical protein KRR40_36150 [Niabella defluvii]|nr:hypothetical protein KRR40_36150 [Niabella sp. I65]
MTVNRIEDFLEMDAAALTRQFQGGKGKKNSAYILIDRIVVKDFDEDDIHRLGDSIGTAFYEGKGMFTLK